MENISFFLILYALLENMLITLVIFLLLGLKFKIKKFLIISITLATILLLLRTNLPINPLILVIINIFLFSILLFFFYKINFVKIIIAVIMTFLIYTVSEAIVVIVSLNILEMNPVDFIESPIQRTLIFIPQIIIIVLIAILIKKYNYNIKNKINFYINEEKIGDLIGNNVDFSVEKRVTRTLYLLAIFLLIQGLVVISSIWSNFVFQLFSNNNIINDIILTVLMVILTVILFCLITYLVNTLRLQRNNIIERIKEKAASRLKWELQMHNHDNKHHLGMLNMLLQMGKYKKAKKYLQEVTDQYENLQETIRSGNDYLNALIYSKIAKAKKHEVNINIKVKNRLKDMSVTEWDLNRITGNLLDNAIEALIDYPDKKQIELIIDSTNKYNILDVKTKGIVISDKTEKDIFKRGVTSKKDQGHGLGLYICKNLVDNYDGNIYIEKSSRKEYTSFIVEMPVLKD